MLCWHGASVIEAARSLEVRKMPSYSVYSQFKLILLLALLVAFSPLVLNAQVLYGSLTGAITDSSQSVVPGVSIHAVNVGTGVVSEVKTNDSGIYLISNLQPGIYRVTISGPSFRNIVLDNVQVEANRQRRLDATLQVAQVTESVIVTAGA